MRYEHTKGQPNEKLKKIDRNIKCNTADIKCLHIITEFSAYCVPKPFDELKTRWKNPEEKKINENIY